MIEPVSDNILNLVNELYNNLDAKDKIINEQALEIARLKEQKKQAIEYIKWQYENPTYDNVWRKYEVEKLLEILGDKK